MVATQDTAHKDKRRVCQLLNWEEESCHILFLITFLQPSGAFQAVQSGHSVLVWDRVTSPFCLCA